MNLDELRSAQSRERQTDSLQQLRDSFYEEAGRFIRQLREEREHVAANADDPFDSSDVQRLTDEIKTAERTVEAIYERRIGKLVKQASLEAAGMAADVEGLTTEEQEAFDKLVSTIEENRIHVLDEVLANERNPDTDDRNPSTDTTTNSESDDDRIPTSTQNESKQPVPSSEETDSSDSIESSPNADGTTPGISAADIMGDGSGTGATAQEPDRLAPPDVSPEADARDVPVHERTEAQPEFEQPAVADADDGETVGDHNSADVRDDVSYDDSDYSQVDRSVVRITRDVGKILCIDEREYDLSENDIVTLPETNVGPLLANDAAVRLE